MNIASSLKPTNSDKWFVNTGILGADDPVQTLLVLFGVFAHPVLVILNSLVDDHCELFTLLNLTGRHHKHAGPFQLFMQGYS